jgi:two-component system chemotaxis response regulator CheY
MSIASSTTVHNADCGPVFGPQFALFRIIALFLDRIDDRGNFTMPAGAAWISANHAAEGRGKREEANGAENAIGRIARFMPGKWPNRTVWAGPTDSADNAEALRALFSCEPDFRGQLSAGDPPALPSSCSGKFVPCVTRMTYTSPALNQKRRNTRRNASEANAFERSLPGEKSIMTKRVLVVDDSMLMRRMISESLSDAGWEVVAEASNGEDAVSAYQKHAPDAVTLDIVMPGTDGMYALENILGIDPKAKVVVVSALNQTKLISEAIRKGAQDFIAKPFLPEQLQETLSNCV